jgi:hypothetical protein
MHAAAFQLDFPEFQDSEIQAADLFQKLEREERGKDTISLRRELRCPYPFT